MPRHTANAATLVVMRAAELTDDHIGRQITWGPWPPAELVAIGPPPRPSTCLLTLRDDRGVREIRMFADTQVSVS